VSTGVRVELDRVPDPDDVRPEQFMVGMLGQVLAATPVSQHVTVRSRMERRDIPVAEEDAVIEAASDEARLL